MATGDPKIMDQAEEAEGPAGESDCCPGGSCPPQSSGVSRRGFLALSAAAAMAGSGLGQAVAVPKDKNLSRTWLRSLASRGTPTEYTGAALQRIGMPVGGLCTGQVYLSGDGRLWLWDVFNSRTFPYGGADWAGAHYARPLAVDSPFTVGFALRWDTAGGPQTKPLDAAGFSDIRFRGTYPTGQTIYADDGCPVEVDLKVYSPFVPTSFDDSSIPATVLEYTLRNSSGSTVNAQVLGVLENPVCLNSRKTQPIELSARRVDVAGGAGLHHSAAGLDFTAPPERPDVVVEDWERVDYSGWTASGTAFGAGPVTEAETPGYFRREGDLNVEGQRFVTSHNFRAGGDNVAADAHIGSLVSDPITVERKYLGARISGGAALTVGLRVVADGEVVAELNGRESEVFQSQFVDVRAYEGQEITVEIFDDKAGTWGHISVDTIWFTDSPRYGDRPTRADVVVEDWERTDYAGWATSGTAFGAGPVTEAECAPLFRREGSLKVQGTRFVTSYNFRAGGDSVAADRHTGKLTSGAMTIERKYLAARVSGGSGSNVGLRLVVGGAVVGTLRGANSEVFGSKYLDVSGYEGQTGTIEIFDDRTASWGHINVDTIWFTDVPDNGDRSDIVFERWERTTYSGWEVSGTAFGVGPVTEAECPSLFRREGPLQVEGSRFVTSYNFRAGGSTPPDGHQGMLRSRAFRVARRYLKARVSGGGRSDVGLRLVVDGASVAWLRGTNSEILATRAVDVSAYEGKIARIEVVDNVTGSWAHVNVDTIWFSDEPLNERPLEELPDAGSFGLVAYEAGAQVRPSIRTWATPGEWFDSSDGAAEVDAGHSGLAGTVSVPVQLAANESRTVRFALGWYLPTLNSELFQYFEDTYHVSRHVKDIYADARDVLDKLGQRGDELAAATGEFVRTWYEDSTLPHWFLERTLAPASTLATGTTLRFSDGRFYGYEGIYCCVGTCTHVWNYAQSAARLFPELERDTRERVDYGVGFTESTGVIGYRGEFILNPAADGQAGTILRTYREHQMSADGEFLDRVWPDVKKAMQYLIGEDGEPDGTLEGRQHNTLDAAWYGEIPWISGLYVAALLATAEMADETGDAAFAQQCRSLAERGSARLDGAMWSDQYQYYEHLVDAAHPEATNTNRGCHIDQLFGQTYAHQLGLPRVFGEQKTRTALASMFRNNFLPDPHAYKSESGIPGGRVYSTAGEAGTIMCTWPFGGSDTAPGSGSPGFVGYLNEVWTGQEYQFAAGLMAEGMVDEALAVVRAVHDRYSAEKRNPYNEIECSDHYARGMMSHGVYLAACGYEYHGPRGHLGFAPKITPEEFAGAFTVAEGWGLYRQARAGSEQVSEVSMRYGRLTLRSIALELAEPPGAGGLSVLVEKVVEGQAPESVAARADVDGVRAVVTLSMPITLAEGETLVTTAVRGQRSQAAGSR